MEYRPLRAIISGGGTGGHIFPAISIANKLKELNPETEILFVGATGKMEMEKVPAAGYRIVGLPIVGMQRQLNLKNIINDVQVPFRVLRSVSMAKKLIREFRPDIAIGVGGYASAPLLFAATRMKIPALIQEQNGFAGLTNKMLGKRVQKICVAYEGMERFFPAEKIVMSGNPIRKEVSTPPTAAMKAEAMAYYHLNPEKKHLFIVGGSLGSGTLNRSMKRWIEAGCPGGENLEVIWQCGRYYKKGVDEFMEKHPAPGVQHHDFIARMDLAYAAADAVVTRSGQHGIRTVRDAQGGHLRSLPQRGGGPPDAQCDGARAPRRRPHRQGCRSPGETDGYGRGTAGRPGPHRHARGERREDGIDPGGAGDLRRSV